MNAVIALYRELRESGLWIDPTAARMQDVPTELDTTPHPYVEAMVKKLGTRLLGFLCTGIHEHYDVHVMHLPVVSRYVRVLAPFLNPGFASRAVWFW